jgi:hypothetical protein
MASTYSAISKGRQAAAAGEDFFAQELQRGVTYFCCLPVKLAFKAAKKLVQREGVRSVLVVPEWESAPFWIALREDKQFQLAVKQVARFEAQMVAFKLLAGNKRDNSTDKQAQKTGKR